MPTAVLRRTVAQLFMVGLPGPMLDRATRAFLAEHPPGGIILFRRNVRSARQLRALVAALHTEGAGLPPLVAIDHEGGRVHRLAPPFTHFPPAAALGASGRPQLACAVGLAMGRELRAVGIDLNFAPVLDVLTDPHNMVIGDRAFSTNPRAAARLGIALARGLARAGVLACGKHFPGHGGTRGDSHVVLPRVQKSRHALEAEDLLPFRRAIAAGIPALMTAHVVYAALDPRRPATLSRAICYRLLRRQLGFDGVLFSDDLEMHAVAGRVRPGPAAVQALRAGCDMLLVCRSPAHAREAMHGVESALERGTLAPAVVTRALARVAVLRQSRRSAPGGPLGWPAHTRLAARVR